MVAGLLTGDYKLIVLRTFMRDTRMRVTNRFAVDARRKAMKITRMRFKGLGSLADVELDGLGELVVIAGRNGSGKSYVVEGLRMLFEEFQLVGGQSASSGNEFLWHRRRVKVPIEVELELALSREEGEAMRRTLADGGKLDIGEGEDRVELTRELHYGANWRTRTLTLGGTPLVQEDEWVGPEGATEAVKASPVPGWKLYLFGPADTRKSIQSRALLVKEGHPVAYESDEHFNELAGDGWLAVSSESRGLDPNSWGTAQGLTVAGRIPNEAEAPELYEFWAKEESEPARSAPGAFAKYMTKLMQGGLMLVPASRHVPSTGSARSSFLDPGLVSRLTSLGTSAKLDDQTEWYNVRQEVEKFVGKQIEPNPGQFTVYNGELRLPHDYIGGGEQSILQLLWLIRQAQAIVTIEEPETHLHPALAKDLFARLEEVSSERQVIISTHSPMLVDKDEEACNWLLRPEGGQTRAERIRGPEAMRLMMAELGVVPSDVFLKDMVLFVEGETEAQAVFPLWAEKLGLSLRSNPRVGVLPVGGDSQLVRALRPWIEVMEYAPADYLAILDGHAGAVRDQLERELGIPGEKIKVLSKQCIEDFYPKALISEGLRALFDMEVSETDIPDDERATVLDRKIKESVGNKSWKVALGTYVASRMEKVPEEVGAILRDVKKRYGSRGRRKERPENKG
jgi:hypothetical protein